MRFIVLLAAVVVQLCLGGLYAWTTFVPHLRSSCSLSTAQTQIIFGALIAVFTVTMVFAGRVLEAKGPRLLLILSGVLFALGYLVASLSGGAFLWLLLAISGVVGIATGLGYVCPLSACMKWFPQHKGLVTGIAVAGFGAGAIVLATLAEGLLERGASVLTIFRWVGLGYGTAILAAGVVMKFPANSCVEPGQSAPMGKAPSKDPFFWALITAMFCGTFAGLLVIGNLMPMGLASGVTPAHVAFSVSAFAVGNGIGRIAWGRVVDRVGRRTIRISLWFLAAALVGLLPGRSHAVAFTVISMMIGLGFGACFVIHATLVASRYGANRVGSIYPLIFLAYGAAGISGPAIGGWLYDITESYTSPICVSIAVVVLGLSTSGSLLYATEKNRL